MNSKLKIIKYKAILFFIGLIFLSASFIIIYLNFRFNSENIIKVNANIESIEHYEYGIIKKQKFVNVIYSFTYEGKEIILTNSYLEYSNNNLSVNSKTEILYDKTSNTIVTEPRIYTLIMAFIFIILAIIVIVFGFKLKQNNIYVSPKLDK
ncbi:hypothetical protein [Brachyspira hyodysenteriae]|uniref:DUF3592 domain-containing protein n=1 Tax=Brachyspira hyodysenteriae (strain ATCC 49526 / WA1) TaxID=565034 RepID=A0A3B6VC13_BRAHW|nr:hypothetical protein [Brachyspira hyodysenteriae]ACN83603.1 hypothetical protein BHWA1_01123 [Brachyspira hyodysenteriae WA1]KLI14007.1 hypothetical protein SU46_12120 [Brachyspira hyodysenteriae]KLI18497.1 hypothetical protein SU44_01975 [Brachyspira hyodysenteriae]KLI20056.1 hypothetical protein SU43_13355 [Brachyspira hyodysenteriae]KLI27913.1 hypothetical protein SR30_00915 [Brachyspira hyodysenteriae]